VDQFAPRGASICPDGTYLVTGYPVPFEITVPDGWFAYEDGGLAKDDPGNPTEYSAVSLTFWPAGYVPTDACAWQNTLVQIGPSAEAFVDAMTAQTSSVTTPPVKVVMGDYSGFEFDYAVESDVDFTTCDVGKFCVYSYSAQDCNGRVYARHTMPDSPHCALELVEMPGPSSTGFNTAGASILATNSCRLP